MERQDSSDKDFEDGAPAAEAEDGEKETDWLSEIRSIAILILAVLAFHSFIAKPFYIPSMSMMPTLLVGDRLLVSKYPYGWSWVSPSFHILPRSDGRVFGRMPERGDIVILAPKDQTSDYIKRVIGLPGETFEMRDGQVFIDGKPIRQEVQPSLELDVDENSPCYDRDFPGRRERGSDGELKCFLPIVREYLPNGVYYDTIDALSRETDNVPPVKIPEGHVYLLGDNRDHSSDSRVSARAGGLDGPIPWSNIGGRAEFITFSLDGSATLNPVSWFTAMRGGRAFTSLRPDRVEEDE